MPSDVIRWDVLPFIYSPGGTAKPNNFARKVGRVGIFAASSCGVCGSSSEFMFSGLVVSNVHSPGFTPLSILSHSLRSVSGKYGKKRLPF
jgi:hypothetical protein